MLHQFNFCIKILKGCLTPLFFIILPLSLSAQQEYSSVLASGSGLTSTILSDYQCIGINPANLGINPKGRKVYFGLADISAGLYSEPLRKSDISNLFKDNELNDNERLNTIQRFTEGNLNGQVNVGLLGISYHDDRIGGFGMAIRERGFFNINLNGMAAELLWLGFNSDYFDQKVLDEINGQIIAGVSSQPKPAAELFKGTSYGMFWAREYNLSYGTMVFQTPALKIYAGAGVKYFMGYAMAEIRVDGERFYGYSSMSDVFGIEYAFGNASLAGQLNTSPFKASNAGNNAFTPCGNGIGADLGFSMLIDNQLMVSCAINDIGSISWTKNVYEASFSANISRIEMAGIPNESFHDIINAFIVEDDLFEWKELSSIPIRLPTTMRMGGLYQVSETLDAGLDFVLPLNNAPGSKNQPLTSVGARLKAGNWVSLTGGVSVGGGVGLNFPLGFTLSTGNAWEFGIATRDLASLIKDNSPHLSVTMGFLRFSFGNTVRNSETQEVY
jgi:hypothetical protein